MITPVVQRWRERRDTYRPAREVVDLRRMEVAAIPGDTTARAFVEAHHYSGSYPAARFRFGLYERAELVGVVVFSQPVSDAVLDCLPREGGERAELGRLVLLDRVGANAETWLVARCFELLRAEGLTGIVSLSDPIARTASDGGEVFPGHVGTIYQAGNATYLGRATARTLRLLPDGSVLNARTRQKLLAGERGWRYAADLLDAHGAPPLADGEDRRAWATRAIAQLTRPLRHPGNHRYAWALRRRDRKHIERWAEQRGCAGLAYPKFCGVTSRSTTARAA